MFRNFVSFLIIFVFFRAPICWAALSVTKTQDISFGSYIQLTDNASISWQNSGDCVVNGLYKQTTCQLGSIQIHDHGVIGIRWDKNYTVTSSSGAFTGCQITVSNMYVQSNDVAISGTTNNWTFTSSNEYINLSVTADIQLNGFCEAGFFEGSLPINIHAENWQGFNEDHPLTVSLSITLDSKLSVTQTQELNFGSIVRNDIGGTVVLSPINQVTYNGIFAANSSTSNGIFAIDGIAGRVVNINLPSQVTIYNQNNSSLLVNNFVSNVGNSLTLIGTDGMGTGTFGVGATLNIPPSAQDGDYSGTYTVTVSY